MRPRLQRLIAAGPGRRTRFHDQSGRRLPLRELRHVPRNLGLATGRRLSGALPALPWIPYDAVARLDGLLQPGWRAIEFGSGSSTAWYAARVAQLHSIESDPDWYARLEPELPTNVRYELRDGERYWDLGDHADGSVDLVVVDGRWRDRCVEAAVPKVRPGGWMYLDNTDRAGHDAEIGRALAALQAAAAERGGTVEDHTGLPVGMLAATAWTLARL